MGIVDFSKVVPIVYREDNVLLNRNGDITFCFRCNGFGLCEKTMDEIDKFTDSLSVGFTYFDRGITIHKQDVYTKKKYTVESSTGGTYLTNAYYDLYKNKEYIDHISYIFVSKSEVVLYKEKIKNSYKGEDLVENKSDGFDKNHREIIDAFEIEIRGWIKFMGDSGLEIIALKENEVDDAILGWFSLYDSSFVADIDLNNREIGVNKFNMVCINNAEQLPASIVSGRLNSNYQRYSEVVADNLGKRTIGLYSDFMSTLGYDYQVPHVVNQIFYIDGKNFWKLELEKIRTLYRAFSGFSPENKILYNNVINFDNATKETNETVIRCHINILFWETASKIDNSLEEIRSRLKEMGITGYVPSRDTIHNIFFSSCPGNANCMPVRETFLGHAVALVSFVLKETVKIQIPSKDKKGLVFTDRISNTLIQRDCWFDVYQKTITNRNWIGVGKSGSGKSSMTIEIMRQYYEMGFNCTVLDIGRSFEVFAKSHDGNYIIYEDGVELGVNPFSFNGQFMTVEELEFLTSFTSVLWRPNDLFTDNQNDALEKLISTFYGLKRVEKTDQLEESTGFYFEKNHSDSSIKTLYKYVQDNKELILDITKNNSDYFNYDSFILSIEKYVSGKFDRLLLGGTKLDTSKRLTIWELDNIKDHPILFPIVSMLIMYITTNVIWKQASAEKLILIEEAWKLLEKPSMVSYIRWLYKTIRKFNGGVGLNIQNGSELTKVEEIRQAVLSNSDLKFIMSHTVPDAKELAKILGWNDHALAKLLSIPLDDAKASGKKKFTELLSVVGADIKPLRLMVSKEQIVNFLSESNTKEKLFKLVAANNGNWEVSVKEFSKLL